MFVLTADGGLVPLQPTKFELEDHFQELLERYPALLSGELIDPEQPRRWVLVAREMPIPGEAEGAGIWSVDHLFLDQDGVPTIVEVKRQTDSRLRREVVAQMLDYAANASAYWHVDSLRAAFETKCQSRDIDPEQELRDKLFPQLDSADFWNRVKTNLEAGKIRLLFVADVIPRELRVIVEFLNRQMNPAEVLALELRQYAGENGLRTLAPTLFGQTEGARGLKSVASARDWDKASFFEQLSSRATPEAVDVARQLLTWIEGKTSTGAIYGHGKVEGSITGYIKVNGLKLYPMMLMTSGRLYFNFRDCMKPPFDSDAKRQDLLARLNGIDGIDLPGDCINKQPSISMEVLTEIGRTKLLLDVMDWFASELK